MDYRKVYGGTPIENGSRCDSCSWAQVIQGYSANERIVMCDRLMRPVVIPFRVAECNGYLNQNLPPFEQLKLIALDLSVEKGRKVRGFVTPESADSEEDDELVATTDA